MPAGILNAKKLDTLPAGTHSDGGNLFFVVAPKTGTRSWVFKFMWGGLRKELTIGVYPAMSLSAARTEASVCKTDVLQGRDPRDRYRAAGDVNLTFEKLARKYIPLWIAAQNPRAAERWEKMLTDCKAICDVPVATLSKHQVLDCLTPMWIGTGPKCEGAKPLTAQDYMRKIAKVMDAAIDDDLRTAANPAQWKGALALKLPKPREVLFKQTGALRNGRKSMHFKDLPAFMQAISYETSTAARAVEFAILTGGRSKEVCQAEWSMYDEERGLLNLPAALMGKTKQPHTVVLCPEAIALLASLPRRSKYIFPSDQYRHKRGANDHIEGHALLDMVRKFAPVDLHGFRSTFRNYAAAETDASFETAETAIAHLIGNDTTRAYLNDPVFEKRAKLMAQWGAFACSKRPKGDPLRGAPAADNVVQLRPAAAA